jgi:hypothetical protein
MFSVVSPTKRGLAVGLSLSVGGVIWSVMFDQLINVRCIGYAWTVRAIGLTLVNLELMSPTAFKLGVELAGC